MSNLLVKSVIKLLSVDCVVPKKTDTFKLQIVWTNVLVLIYLHGAALYGAYLQLAGYCKLATIIWLFGSGIITGISVTGGAHRLWAHKCYKANLPLRIILATLYTMTFQNHIYEWVRDHRVHHKYAETDADPHNAKRGFFFSHVGWLMVKKHPDVIAKGKTIDMSDLEEDAVVMFQKKYYPILVILGTFVIPMMVPIYYWNEDPWVAWYCAAIFRYVFGVNIVWCINSVAHLYGLKPYDKTIGPVQNRILFYLGLGEGYHNYHHTFPWDYKAAEFNNDPRNVTTYVIEFFARLGWAYDLKTASREMILKRVLRTGDGTHESNIDELKRMFVDNDVDHDNVVWGWDDKSMDDQHRNEVLVCHKR